MCDYEMKSISDVVPYVENLRNCNDGSGWMLSSTLQMLHINDMKQHELLILVKFIAFLL